MTNTFLQTALRRAQSKKGKENGFTLIELMVVIAIVGILTAVGLPELTKAQDRAKDSAALQTLTNAAKECSMDLLSDVSPYDFSGNYAAVTSTGATGEGCSSGVTITLASERGDGTEKEANIVFDGVVPGIATLDDQ